MDAIMREKRVIHDLQGLQDLQDLQDLLGVNIRAERQRLGWTLEDLTDRTGISFTYLSRVENGKKNISLSTLYKISRALNINVDQLFKFKKNY